MVPRTVADFHRLIGDSGSLMCLHTLIMLAHMLLKLGQGRLFAYAPNQL
jgi:hypothetical protein